MWIFFDFSHISFSKRECCIFHHRANGSCSFANMNIITHMDVGLQSTITKRMMCEEELFFMVTYKRPEISQRVQKVKSGHRTANIFSPQKTFFGKKLSPFGRKYSLPTFTSATTVKLLSVRFSFRLYHTNYSFHNYYSLQKRHFEVACAQKKKFFSSSVPCNSSVFYTWNFQRLLIKNFWNCGMDIKRKSSITLCD